MAHVAPKSPSGTAVGAADRKRSSKARTPRPGPPAADGTEEPKGTRERILDIALDLFIDQGFDKTSLRQIAEKLGFSKAALYYHFASKDDILLALHYRLHDLGRDALSRLSQEETSVMTWSVLLEQLTDQMIANRKVFVLHERNRAAFEHLHEAGHDTDHDDLEVQFRRVLRDPTVPLKDRVRMACSLGAVMSGLLLAGDIFADVPSATLGEMLRDAVRDLLEPGTRTA
jgi:AcrR family transcriptional regulator